jgi:hypothetical protein
MNLIERGWESVNWSHLAQARDQWWVLVNIVINLRDPQNFGYSLNG